MDEEKVESIPVDKVVVPDWRVRKEFDRDSSFEELKKSINTHGLMQPIEVVPIEDGRYELIFGLRRLEAVKELGWKEVPAIVRQRDEIERQMAEIAENIHRVNYSQTDRMLAIAKYAKLMAALMERRGRPQALTQEQVERAVELRKQGESLREIGEELGVDPATVLRHLENIGNITKGVAKRSQRDHFATPISRLTTEEKVEERPVAVPKPTFGEKGIRPIAEALGVSYGTVHKAIEVEKDIAKYPALAKLETATSIIEGCKFADLLGLTQDEVAVAVDLALKKEIGIKVAMSLQKVPQEHWNGFLELKSPYHRLRYYASDDRLVDAILYMHMHPEEHLSPEEAFERAEAMNREYRIRLWSYEANSRISELASKEGVSENHMACLLILEALLNKGLLSEQAYAEACRNVKVSDQREFELYQLYPKLMRPAGKPAEEAS